MSAQRPAPATSIPTGEVARQLGLSRHTVLRAARRGDLPWAARTPGGAYRFHPDEVAAFADRLYAPPPNVERAQARDARTSASLGAAPEGEPEAARRESEKRFRLAFDEAPIGMALAALDGRLLEVNQVLCTMLGYAEHELLGMGTPALTHPDDAAASREGLRRLLAGEATGLALEKRYLHRQGRVVWVDYTASLLRDGAGRPHYLIYQLRDISKRKVAEAALRAQEERLQAVVRNAPIIVFALDHAGIFTLTAGQALAALGSAPGRAVGRAYQEIYPGQPEVDAAVAGEPAKARATVAGRTFEVRYVPERDEGGSVQGVIGVATDITEQVAAEAALVAAEARTRALLERVEDLLCILEADGTIRYASPSYERILGYTPAALVGRNAFEYFDPAEIPAIARSLRATRARGEAVDRLEMRVRHADGTWRTLESVRSDRLADPAIQGMVITSRDITERKRAEDELAYAAHHDALTDLPNRALLADRLRQALREVEHVRASLAVLLLDLDGFKLVNDTLGHQAGDALLRAVAGRLLDATRASDTVARLGGDEFAILLPHTGEEGAVRVAGKIRIALAEPVKLAEGLTTIGGSVGVALFPEHGMDAKALLRAADLAMYAAKRAGGGFYMPRPQVPE